LDKDKERLAIDSKTECKTVTNSMNKIILYGFILVLSACTTTLPVLSEKPEISIDAKGDFVELFDGTVVNGTISEVKGNFVVINGNNYRVKNIRSYQYRSVYKTAYKKDFLRRIVKGKINVYERSIRYAGNPFGATSSERGGGAGIHYYIQKGDSGKFEFFDIKTLERMVKDNSKALYWVNEYKKLKKKNDSYLDYAIEAYNAS
jgi:hypothetical protein